MYLTTTKKILWLSWIFFIVLTGLSILGFNVDTSLTIVGGVATTVTTGFYLWKSKCENKEKIAIGIVEKLADKYGIENVIDLTGEILKD